MGTGVDFIDFLANWRQRRRQRRQRRRRQKRLLEACAYACAGLKTPVFLSFRVARLPNIFIYFTNMPPHLVFP